MNIIIPIGDDSNLFKTDNYKYPTPLINIFGSYMIFYLIDNINLIKDDNLIIIYQKDLNKYNFKSLIENRYISKFIKLGINLIIIELDEYTNGPVETIYNGLGKIDINNLNSLCKINEINPSIPCCITRANFNTKGEKNALYCQLHAIEGMVNVLDKRKCEYEDYECDSRPCFNIEGMKKGKYCAIHKKEGMINIFAKRCKSEWCYTSPKNDKYNGYCLFCFVNLFPEQSIARNYKTKEFAVVEFIKNNFPGFDWVADQIIKDGCSRRRPDLLLDLGYQIIIVEIDEDQHTNYENICENRRMMELSQDLGHRPIIFIRFNPDSYINNGLKITSCWEFNKKGISYIKKNKTVEWAARLDLLKNTINHWSNPDNISDKLLETVKLFYN